MSALRARRALIRERWETLLRTERVNTPLANPDSLVYLIDTTLESVFGSLLRPRRKPVELTEARALSRPACLCGRNPYLAYFIAGEQALLEALVLAQAEDTPAGSPERENDVAEVYFIMRHLARSEILSFCGLCVHREAPHPAHSDGLDHLLAESIATTESTPLTGDHSRESAPGTSTVIRP